MTIKLKQFLVVPDDSIRKVIACIDQNAKGIVLVVDRRRRLTGTITDGDIRRAILKGIDPELPIQTLLENRAETPYPLPLTAPVGTSSEQLLSMMKRSGMRHIPLVDEKGRVRDIALLTDLVKEEKLPLTTVIMAGGYGRRLHPLTKKIPKPMLPVGRQPILELIIKQLRKAGIRNLNISTHYKAEKITKHFGNGNAFGVDIHYINEKRPLGTAGALGLIQPTKNPILVINGDILSQVNLRSMLDFHREHKADMTIAVQKYDIRISYGVVETEDFLVRRLIEKPNIEYLINAGVYLMEPFVPRLIPEGQHFDMTDLIQKLLDFGKRVVSFPIREYWLDIGNHEDYDKARIDMERGKLKL